VGLGRAWLGLRELIQLYFHFSPSLRLHLLFLSLHATIYFNIMSYLFFFRRTRHFRVPVEFWRPTQHLRCLQGRIPPEQLGSLSILSMIDTRYFFWWDISVSAGRTVVLNTSGVSQCFMDWAGSRIGHKRRTSLLLFRRMKIFRVTVRSLYGYFMYFLHF
jgi:hypothetical protein